MIASLYYINANIIQISYDSTATNEQLGPAFDKLINSVNTRRANEVACTDDCGQIFNEFEAIEASGGDVQEPVRKSSLAVPRASDESSSAKDGVLSNFKRMVIHTLENNPFYGC